MRGSSGAARGLRLPLYQTCVCVCVCVCVCLCLPFSFIRTMILEMTFAIQFYPHRDPGNAICMAGFCGAFLHQLSNSPK